MSANNYTCDVDPAKFLYANAIPTIVTDLVMVMLPVPYVWGLQLPRIQKIALGCVFLAGGFVTIVSIVRFYYLLSLDLEDPDITWNFVTVGIWSFVEGNTAIVCACLPFLRPVINKISSVNPFILASVPLNGIQQCENSSRSFNQTNVFPTWGFNKSHGASTTPMQSQSHDELDHDEHPFAHLADGAPETDTPARHLGREFADLEAVVASPSSRYIPITRIKKCLEQRNHCVFCPKKLRHHGASAVQKGYTKKFTEAVEQSAHQPPVVDLARRLHDEAHCEPFG
ncbi:hypothetical protein J3458_021509 [Metarhizium acridum]|uniref:uncharacterized protein n=1 Tax=Metarhizium acridum TaxID=92637 RepID=UPI001C6B01B5|nr:hypothetical protein J3458_021509 [Metarhizium acridum]